MEQDILIIDNIEYDHGAINQLSSQSPDIVVNLKDIEVVGIKIDQEIITETNTHIETSNSFQVGGMIVFKFYGKIILLSGYDEYLKAVKSGLNKVHVKLLSRPVMKKARFLTYVKPDPSASLQRGRNGEDRRSSYKSSSFSVGPLDEEVSVKQSRSIDKPRGRKSINT